MKIQFKLNGEQREANIPDHRRLIDFIREDMGLTGTKEGCGNGECGACTVLMDGMPVRSCLVLAPEIDGSEITTIEGLDRNGKLHPVQQAFLETGAVQCGFCTAGFVLAVKALLDRNASPDEAEIMEALGGHLCRCTGYETIFEAVERAIELNKKAQKV